MNDHPLITVGDLMTREVFSLREMDSLKIVKELMSLARIRHVPIVDEMNRFIGLVTHRDILEATISRFAEVEQDIQEEIHSGIPVTAIMRRDVVTVSPELSLREAAEILLGNKYGCLPVVEDGLLVGILTEADFLKLTIDLMDSLQDV